MAAPIHIAPGDGDQMASLQFDLGFDAASVEVLSVEAGACALQAAKEVVFSRTAAGTVRVIVAGMNQNTIQEGVVATVYLQRVDTGSAPAAMELDSIVVADPMGNSVESTGANLMAEALAEEQSAVSSLTSDASTDASESRSSSQPGSAPSKELSDDATPQSQPTWSTSAPLGFQSENGQVEEDSIADRSSGVVAGEALSRVRASARNARAMPGDPSSFTGARQQYEPGHVLKPNPSGGAGVTLPSQAAPPSRQAMADARRAETNAVVAVVPYPNALPGTVSRQDAALPMEALSGAPLRGSWSWLWLLAPVAAVLGVMGARHLFVKRPVQHRGVRTR